MGAVIAAGCARSLETEDDTLRISGSGGNGAGAGNGAGPGSGGSAGDTTSTTGGNGGSGPGSGGDATATSSSSVVSSSSTNAGGSSMGGAGGMGGSMGGAGGGPCALGGPGNVMGCAACSFSCDGSLWPATWNAVPGATYYVVEYQCFINTFSYSTMNTGVDLCNEVGMCNNGACANGTGPVSVKACDVNCCSAPVMINPNDTPVACGGGVCC
jgi:hypothetical protein